MDSDHFHCVSRGQRLSTQNKAKTRVDNGKRFDRGVGDGGNGVGDGGVGIGCGIGIASGPAASASSVSSSMSASAAPRTVAGQRASSQSADYCDCTRHLKPYLRRCSTDRVYSTHGYSLHAFTRTRLAGTEQHKWLRGEADLQRVDLAALFEKCKLRKEKSQRPSSQNPAKRTSGAQMVGGVIGNERVRQALMPTVRQSACSAPLMNCRRS